MKKEHILPFIPPALFMAASILALWSLRAFPEIGKAGGGPLLVPLILSVGLVLVALALIPLTLRQIRAESGPETKIPAEGVPQSAEATPWAALAGFFGVIVAYLIFMPLFGFISGTTLFLAACLYCFGYRGGVHAWAFAFAGSFLLYGLFGLVMNVPLPSGWLG